MMLPVFFLPGVFFLGLAHCGPGAAPPVASGGVLDLRGWDFARDGSVPLDGEWFFLRDRLAAPAEPWSAAALMELPGGWNGYTGDGGPPFGGQGFATYRLSVLLSDPPPQLLLSLPTVHSAFRFYANGVVVGENGRVGTSKSETRPQYLPMIASVERPGTRLELVYQIANFHHRKGGTWTNVYLGDEHLRRDRENELRLNFFVLGAFCVMGLYHLGLFLYRGRDLSPLFFGIST